MGLIFIALGNNLLLLSTGLVHCLQVLDSGGHSAYESFTEDTRQTDA